VEKDLIPPGVSASKGQVRDYLRRCGQEDVWTELQGYVYGARMQETLPFPGVLDFFAQCKDLGVTVYIISHKTQYPFQGTAYDLHQAAHKWLESYGFYDPARIGLSPAQVYFELTKPEKLIRIARSGCDYFIDDLPEFLSEPGFPAGVDRILFDPNDNYPMGHHFHRATSWAEIEGILMSRRNTLL
jgi:hypothetical protein